MFVEAKNLAPGVAVVKNPYIVIPLTILVAVLGLIAFFKAKILLSVYKDVKKALADVVSSEERLRLAEVSQKEAKETLRLEKLKYRGGKGVINDVLDAETALRKADYFYCSAVSDYNTSIFGLYLSEGLLSENYDSLLSQEKTYVKNRDSKDEK